MKARRYSQPKRRGLTAAQQKAHDEAYAACDHTVEGRFAKGDVVSDHKGAAWKIATYGIRFHEDVSRRIYGVQPARGPKGWAETRELRQAIETIRTTGTRTTHDRTPAGIEVAERPEAPAVATWRDGRAGSLASFPELTVYEGGIVGVYCPVYDDSPIVAWVRDVKLAKRLTKAIAACPSPVSLPEVNVRERHIEIEIAIDHPRYAAYAAARGAEQTYGYASTFSLDRVPRGLKLPMPEWRRVKAELDATEVPNP